MQRTDASARQLRNLLRSAQPILQQGAEADPQFPAGLLQAHERVAVASLPSPSRRPQADLHRQLTTSSLTCSAVVGVENVTLVAHARFTVR